ncbi:membrane-associated tyrosine- and threonine-specific cdc2-inhibitory kinase [Hemicordylus capensis]|uniref:membrane-associated tyrosine- and threonine-specific cdc2-inhibitory kinase n=1 Tax=Hemicordylus capensis TaxID=884348 RepID=UPI0023031615|nr:membrane-associated tyrosine- and threonine-specific cdc2-inhibitory kinase [Hemicordylus capensis]XP_053116441.1 membrane-associated tyrosine- and threonine-specific cdc2-inhibitory kinase [Hemicordylus capensis]
MPVPFDCAGAESQLSHTPLPVPAFFREVESSFSSKRAHRPLSYTVPPRPRHKSTLTVSRIFSDRRLQPWTQLHPRSVSFHGAQKQQPPLHSGLYDASKRELFFRQCFQQLSRLGRGSFGEVYKVRCKEDGQLYAVKRSVEPFRGESDRQRKLAEVRKHERVGHHPNCVSFVQAWEERGQLYIQTELCPGSLQQYCEKYGPLPEWQVRAFLWDLLQGLHHLHDRNLLHMDVKPANIFLSSNNVCKLGDFGLMLELDSGDLTDAQEGDPRYMAPELLRGEYTKAADIFSLGITILDIASNLELPNGGEGWQQLRQGYLPPEFTSGLSADLKMLLAAMLEPNHQLRPSVETLLSSRLMQKTERWRKLMLLAQSGIQQGTAMCQILLRFMHWLWEAVWSPAHWLLFWHQSLPVTPPHSPFLLPLEDSSLSSDWGEEEESLGEDFLELTETAGHHNCTCPVGLQPSDIVPGSPQLNLYPCVGSTSTPRHPSPQQTGRMNRSLALQGSPNLSCISPEPLSGSSTSSDLPPVSSLRRTLVYEEEEEEDVWEAVSPRCSNHCSTFEPKNLLSMFEDSMASERKCQS